MKSVFSGLVSLGAVASAATAGASVKSCLDSAKVPVTYPADPAYANLTEPFNLRLQYKPVGVVYPKTTLHVQDAVRCAAKCGVKVQAKSGGHSYASFSSGGQDGSLVIDLEPFQNIQLTNNVAKVGGGVRLGNLAQGVWDQGKRAISHGTCPGVGIGGHFTHGGYGHTSRNWGIALDHIVAVDVVLADGSLVKASPTENQEVFWALRGAADSFGIIVNFYLRTQAAPASVTYFSYRWADALYKSKDDFTKTFLHIQDFATNKTVVDNRISFGIYLDGSVYNLGGTFFGTPEEFNKTIGPELIRGVPVPSTIIVQAYNWIDYLILMSDKTDIREPLTGYDEHDTFFAKSITVPEKNKLSANALNAFYDHIKAGFSAPWFTIINLYGGPGSAINTKDTNFAAYKDRDSLWVFQNYGQSPTDKSIPFVNKINEVIIGAQPGTEFGAYLNYVDPSYSPAEAHELYYGKDLYNRLLQVKKRVDPKSVFWNPQAIGA